MTPHPSTSFRRNVGKRACYRPPVTFDEIRLRLSSAIRQQMASGRSREDIAGEVGFTDGWLDHVEAGRREPKLDRLSRLAEVVNLQLVVELVDADAPVARLIAAAGRASPRAISAAMALLEEAAGTQEGGPAASAPETVPPPQRRRGALRVAR